MPADERREQILTAATRAFAQGGYAGTSTDQVAKEAGVSQPYVVRMFGSKLDLFVDVLRRACAGVEQLFATVIDEPGFDSEEGEVRLGLAYSELLARSDILRVMMHGFAAASIPEIGATARGGMESIFLTLRTAGWDDERVRDFLAQGMLLNVMLSIGAFTPAADGLAATGGLSDLLRACLPEELITRIEQS